MWDLWESPWGRKHNHLITGWSLTKNTSCQHELQLKKWVYLGIGWKSLSKTLSRRRHGNSDPDSKHIFLTSFPVDMTATTGNLLTSTSVTPTVAKRPISDGPMWVPLASTHSPLLMSCPIGLKIIVQKKMKEKQNEIESIFPWLALLPVRSVQGCSLVRLSKCQYYLWLKNDYKNHQAFHSLQRYFTVYKVGCLQTWYLGLVEPAPGFEPLVLLCPTKTRRSNMVSWAIQRRLISFNFSEVYTAYSTHYTETLWFKHHHCSPDLCVKIVIECMLKLWEILSLMSSPGQDQHWIHSFTFLSLWYLVLPVFPMLSLMFVCWSGIPSRFFLLLSANLICSNNFNDGISRRPLVW